MVLIRELVQRLGFWLAVATCCLAVYVTWRVVTFWQGPDAKNGMGFEFIYVGALAVAAMPGLIVSAFALARGRASAVVDLVLLLVVLIDVAWLASDPLR